MRIDVLTLFPGMFKGVLQESMLKIALEKKLLDIRLSNIRNFSYDRHCSVDDRPYGGGPGMLLKPEPVFRAVESIGRPQGVAPLFILFSPQGEVFRQALAQEWSKLKHLVLICGHYEGFDERIRIGLQPKEISIGDYILTGGELPAMVIIDAVARLIPGVLGAETSTENESFSTGFLEGPQYTRPAIWRGMKVPEVLSSGHHKQIDLWRQQQAQIRTQTRRPDLLIDSENNV